MPNLIDRARAYVAKMPAAVSGQNGHGATFEVAKVLLHFFELSREDAAKVLDEYNGRSVDTGGNKCPWSAKELNHKLTSAAKSPWTGPRAKDNERAEGSGGRKSGKSANESRTVRTGFSKSVQVPTIQTGQSRTVRTDFLDNFIMCAQAHIHEAESGSSEKPSEPSEPIPPAEQERNVTQSAGHVAEIAVDPVPGGESGTGSEGESAGAAFGLVIERTGRPLPPGCVFIGKEGKVFQAQRTADTLVIGRRIKREAKIQ